MIDKHHVFYQVSTIYSAQEMNDAEWFYVRSVWLNDYPYPKDEYERLVYGIEKKTQCLCNKKQVGDFAMKREIKWGKQRYFCSMNWIHDELFVNQEVVEQLRNSGLKGFHFRDVNIKSMRSETVSQLVVEEYLKQDLDLKKTAIKKLATCRICGNKKVIGSGREQYYFKDAFKDLAVDIVKSKTVYGDGALAIRETYINQKFYTFLKDNELDKNLVFEPIFFSDL